MDLLLADRLPQHREAPEQPVSASCRARLLAFSHSLSTRVASFGKIRGQHGGQHQLAQVALFAHAAWLNHADSACVNEPGWAHLGSNQGPLACEASALPLSYAPGRGAQYPLFGDFSSRKDGRARDRWSRKSAGLVKLRMRRHAKATRDAGVSLSRPAAALTRRALARCPAKQRRLRRMSSLMDKIRKFFRREKKA